MIQHIVMLNLKEPQQPDELSAIMHGLQSLQARIDGFIGFEHGPNKDFEEKSKDYPYGFICRFDSEDALKSYAVNPDHQALGARLVALCNGGGDGIMVVDLAV